MGDKLIMSTKERERKVMMEAVGHRQLSLKEAADRMTVSYRQARRIWKRYQANHDEGLIHRSRGRPSSHAFEPHFKARVLSQYQECYSGFGPTFACEKLAEEGYHLSDETLRRWLKAAGIGYRQRKRKGHRQRRDRREAFGELVQIDGSIHSWFGDSGKQDCLLDMVDDATGTTLALLATGETTQVLLSTLMLWIRHYGIPKEVYVDLKSVYISYKENSFSVFETVCQQLGIKINPAYSAQAKGRVERKHAVYQDRFVKELALRDIKKIEQANSYLLKEFIPLINKKFALSVEDKPNVHRPADSYGDLNQIICWRFERQVRNDWTFQWRNQHYQILSESARQVRPKHKIELRLHLGGDISLWREGQRIHYRAIAAPIKRVEFIDKGKRCFTLSRREVGKRGKENSPWKQFNPKWLKGTREKATVSP